MNSRKVSILIPTKNRKGMLRNALLSAINQTYLDLEIIVNDNNSTDGTYEEIKDLLEDDRIVYCKEESDLSMLENWSSGFLKVTGDLFVRLDDDNVFAPDFVEKCLLAIDEYKLDSITFSALVLSGGGVFKLFDESDLVYELDYKTSLLLEFYCLTDSNYSMYKSELISEVLEGDPFYWTTLPDRYFNYRLAEANIDGRYRCGFSTMIAGCTRYDDKSKNQRKFFINSYKEFYENNFTVNMMDCQFNFQMQRAHAAYFFLNNCNQTLVKQFFSTCLLDKRLMRSYSMFGHLNQWQYVTSLKELALSYVMFFHSSKEMLKYPFARVHNKKSIYYIFAEMKRFAALNARTIIRMIIKAKVKESSILANFEKGDDFCRNFVASKMGKNWAVPSLCGNFEKYLRTKVADLPGKCFNQR